MELNFKQLNLLSIALTNFYDEVCKTGTTPGMKKDLMELSKLVNDEFSKVSMKRVNIKQILSNPEQKKELMVGVIQFLQNIEGIDTTKEQAENAYDKVQEENQ
jgi:flagellar biosynthesis/type III secretory pathway chaperone